MNTSLSWVKYLLVIVALALTFGLQYIILDNNQPSTKTFESSCSVEDVILDKNKNIFYKLICGDQKLYFYTNNEVALNYIKSDQKKKIYAELYVGDFTESKTWKFHLED